jgi:hypothetical protein
MNPNSLALGAVVLVALTSVYIFISKDWRFSVGALAIQYIGVFILVSISWPMELAAVKMVAGWMAAAILGIAMAYVPEAWSEQERFLRFGTTFRLLAAGILSLAITSLVLHSVEWFPNLSIPIRWGSFFLIGIGLLQLSLTSHPLRVVVGLLTTLSGFEIIYAAVESSTLVTGLLAVVTLGLALVGTYLIIGPTMEANP